MTGERRILLHVGTHKTGTSSFQRSLKRNHAALLPKGVRAFLDRRYENGAYSEFRIGQHMTFAHLVLRDDLLTSPRYLKTTPDLNPRQRERRLMAMAERISAFEEPDVLLSTEQLCFARTEEETARLRAFVERTGRRIETVCAFRPVAEWRESWADEIAKRDDGRQDRFAQLPDHQRIDGEWYFDPDAVRAFWRDFNLTEIAFDKTGNMVERIYAAFGIDPEGLDTDLRINARAEA